MNRSLVTQILGSTDAELTIDAKTLLQLDGSMIVGALYSHAFGSCIWIIR
jgi:hypothetical protein